MKTMSVSEFKARFSDVIEWIKAGKKVAVTYGRKKKVIGYFVPEEHGADKCQLGLLECEAKAVFQKDFKITEEEFLR